MGGSYSDCSSCFRLMKRFFFFPGGGKGGCLMFELLWLFTLMSLMCEDVKGLKKLDHLFIDSRSLLLKKSK